MYARDTVRRNIAHLHKLFRTIFRFETFNNFGREELTSRKRVRRSVFESKTTPHNHHNSTCVQKTNFVQLCSEKHLCSGHAQHKTNFVQLCSDVCFDEASETSVLSQNPVSESFDLSSNLLRCAESL